MDNPWQSCRTIGPLTLHSQEMGARLPSHFFRLELILKSVPWYHRPPQYDWLCGDDEFQQQTIVTGQAFVYW